MRDGNTVIHAIKLQCIYRFTRYATFVDHTVPWFTWALVVDPIADLGSAGVDRRVPVVAISVKLAESVAIIIYALPKSVPTPDNHLKVRPDSGVAGAS